MRFYHNNNINITAEEDWVADYLYQSAQVDSRDEAIEGLQGIKEFCGWHRCDVSNTIEERMRYYGQVSYM